MRTEIDENGEVRLHKDAAAPTRHHVLFWSAVGVSVIVIVGVWGLIIRGVLAQGVADAKQTFNTVSTTVTTLKEETKPARDQVSDAGSEIGAVIKTSFQAAQQRVDAVDIVSEIVKQKIAEGTYAEEPKEQAGTGAEAGDGSNEPVAE